MTRSKKLIVGVAAAICLTACASRPLTATGDVQAGAKDFDQALAHNYQALAQVELAAGDFRDAESYASRAAAAAAGQPTAPDQVELRQAFLKEKYVAELSEAQQRLVGALDKSGRDKAPMAAAHAQASYDCWLEQASEDLQPEDINACKQAFLSAIVEVESALVASVEPPPAPAAPPPATIAQDSYLVFFDFDKAEITPEAMAILESVAASTNGAAVKRIVAVGHADTSGSDAYNLRLSQRRAEAVKSALLGINVRTDSIVTEGRGEREPLVPTGDGVREPQNRRVELTIDR